MVWPSATKSYGYPFRRDDHLVNATGLTMPSCRLPVCRNATKPPSKPAAGGSVHRSAENKRLWLDVVEGAMGGLSLIMVSLQPLWHSLRGMFGLSLLFYGEEFATLAFHIIVFRLSGWKKVRVHVITWENVPVIIWKKARVRSAVPEGTSNAVSKRA